MIRHNIRQLIRQFSWFFKVCNLQNEENSKSVKRLIEAIHQKKVVNTDHHHKENAKHLIEKADDTVKYVRNICLGHV